MPNYGLFPIGDTLNATPVYRPFALDGTITTSGGLVYAKHTNVQGVTDVLIDSASTTWVNRTANQYTTVGYPAYATTLQIAKGAPGFETFAVKLIGKATFSNLGSVGSLSQLRAVINDSCKGNYVAATGTVSNPTVARSGLNRNGVRGVWKPGTTNKFSTPLPVTLVYLNARPFENRTTLISWATYTEVNSQHFEVQRSFNGKDFETIGVVKAAGNSNTLLEYSFVDNSPQDGYNYYRLKQVDIDGHFVYTGIVKVYFDNEIITKKPNMLVYPNPAQGKNFTVLMENFTQDEVLVVVKDITGRDLYSKAVVTRVNNYLVADEFTIDLPPGIYLIVASDHESVVSERLIVR
jgi:hypothetical protein